MECHLCGKEWSKERLFEAVSSSGIVMLCSKCAQEEGLPVVRKPTTFQLKEAEKNTSKGFYDKVREEKERQAERMKQSAKIAQKERQETSLRELVDKNYESRFNEAEKKPRPDLIDNFHWLITRARRNKKISREQLAREISESVAAIKMAEQGILPEDDYRLVNKLESFLNIKIRKQFVNGPDRKPEPARVLKLDSETAQNLTIADLKKMRKARGFVENGMEEKYKEVEEANLDEENDDEVVELVDLDKPGSELTDEEIDKIIFGK